MPEFLPFRGVRYRPEALDGDLAAVTTPPYDVIDEDRRAVLEARHPHNAVRLILPRALPGDAGHERYARAARDFEAWLGTGVLALDPAPRLYRYTMRFRGEDGTPRRTAGVIGRLELAGGDVLPHERTMPKPKDDRLALLRATRANLEPIWGLSLAAGLTARLEGTGPTLARCTDDDGVEHELAGIDDPATHEAVRAAVASAPVVIADGHHRYETALAYRDERRAAGEGSGPADGIPADWIPADWIMAFVVELAEDQLDVRPIHRLLSGLPPDLDVASALAPRFEVLDAGPNQPDRLDALAAAVAERHGLGLVEPERLAVLVPRSADPAGTGPVAGLAATRFETTVVPALRAAGARGLEVSYRHDRVAVAQLVRARAYDAAVLLAPVPVAAIREAAQCGQRMPQKTTFFSPKPRTGLVFRRLDDG